MEITVKIKVPDCPTCLYDIPGDCNHPESRQPGFWDKMPCPHYERREPRAPDLYPADKGGRNF